LVNERSYLKDKALLTRLRRHVFERIQYLNNQLDWYINTNNILVNFLAPKALRSKFDIDFATLGHFSCYSI